MAIALDASRVGLKLSTIEALSASIATIGNIGPGFGLLGPFGSYLAFSCDELLLHDDAEVDGTIRARTEMAVVGDDPDGKIDTSNAAGVG